VELPEDEIAERVAAYAAPVAAYTNGVLGKYRKLVGSAADGAVTG
jgi:dihydroxy-acid dehydratase